MREEVVQLRIKSPFLFLVLILLPNMVQASPYIVVDEPDLEGTVVLFADLFSQGETNCLVAKGSTVSLLKNGFKTELINDIVGQISALAVGDVTGNLRNDLIIGTTNAGALYFYKEQNGYWVREGQPLYLWDTIQKIEIHDFNNDGWGDVVVLTGQGEAQIFLSWEGKLYPFWKSRPNQKITDWQVLDVDQDGLVDLIYVVQAGQVGVLSWDDQEFVTLWENYPWGHIDSLVVLPHQNNPEWLVITSQKILYGWRWREGEVVSSRHFHGAELGERVFYIPEQGLLSSSKKTGISLFELKSSGISELWRVPGVFANQAFHEDGGYLFRDETFNYYRLAQGDDSWRIFVNDQDRTDVVQVLEYEDKLYYNLQELGTELGFLVLTGNYWHFLKQGQYLSIEAGADVVQVDGLNIPIASPIVEWNGAPYAAAELLPLFGWSVEIDQARQQILLYPNWGWWLSRDK